MPPVMSQRVNFENNVFLAQLSKRNGVVHQQKRYCVLNYNVSTHD